MARQTFGRRSVLRTVAVGAVGTAAVPGLASAKRRNVDRGAYGNGHGLDVFLNEETAIKDGPIWDGEIVDMRGREVAEVALGTMTSVNGAPVPEVPIAFDPVVVMVSPGATVRWTWVSNPLDLPFPHDVTSLVNDDGEVVLEEDAGQRYHYHATYTPATSDEDLEEDINPTFEFTFDERGNHLYYCTPHGAPFPQELDGFGVVTNLAGMRGAVKVAGRAL